MKHRIQVGDDNPGLARNEMHAVRKAQLRLPGLKNFYGYVKDKGSREVELDDLTADIGERQAFSTLRTRSLTRAPV